jgi:hypothetical protein
MMLLLSEFRNMNFLHPHHGTHARVAVILTALALTVVFHFFFAELGYGVGAALTFVALVIGVRVVDVFAGKPNNTWAYIFLIPLLICAVAETIYASEVVRTLCLPIMIGSAALFAYWFSAPRTGFWQAPLLWPRSSISETVWPFGSYRDMVSGFGKSKHWTNVLYGLIIALPIVIVIGALFAQADAVFGKTLSDIFRFEDIGRNAWRIIRDLIAVAYFVCAGWMIYTRVRDGRAPKPGASAMPFDKIIVATVLAVLNALFVIFIAVQIAAFFGGDAFVQGRGIAYADYARNGFFQLLAVAGIVFAVLAVIYRATHLREWGTRLLSLGLIAETGIVIASAIRRLLLYIDAYGLSVSRYWAMIVIIVIAAVLAAMAVAAFAKIDYAPLAKGTFIVLLTAFPLLLLYNVEGYVVRANAERFLTGKTDLLDLQYMEDRLSSDSLPALSDLAQQEWPRNPSLPPFSSSPTDLPNHMLYGREGLKEFLGKRHESLLTLIRSDWRKAVVMDYYAAAALSEY